MAQSRHGNCVGEWRAFMEMRPTSAYASEAIRLFWKLVSKNFDLVNLRRLIKQITVLSFLH